MAESPHLGILFVFNRNMLYNAQSQEIMHMERPRFFSVREDEHIGQLRQFISSNSAQVRFFDVLEESVRELCATRHPQLRDDKETFEQVFSFFLKEYTGGRPVSLCGVWIYYPWSGHMVHVLEPDMFEELRTARNKNLITPEEQRAFHDTRIAVAGLSVGSHAALTIAMQGGGARMSIADHDTLSLSNMNRVRSGIQSIGLNKCEAVARQIYEMNPFADIHQFQNGLSTDTIDAFLTAPERIDILVEEMDDIRLKIRIREKAKALGIPVISAADSGDGIILDVERFDIDPSLSIMRGRVDHLDLSNIETVTGAELAAIITEIIDPEDVVPRMRASVAEVGQTLYSWPQLATAAHVAGSALAYAARMLATGGPLKSGRTVISFEDILSFGSL
ncbi:MAG: hypothetical protein COU35_03515 [Candidatus Magasanikbacteria bacterium CG10_big_fil_rev_8_21_14_0_10_47_10]|uniref:THIF-type NAD/FAD binding fold domain-containing protein n=1 Tax=Candidatus Magasanikbacteria bacterium CG10_big_fil_rev_8_21_14_0_10_47_10 TaxID=1974652 RepID=A0A2H0TQ09_9BACT|nr:MAG: hypothetical protein COU35_03515 [Candidatus Magasanikbacteria bacterium CG10_big_fil_rev_8_21_14_0_10_47_10]